MGWCIGRTEVLTNPLGARRKALAKLRGLAELDDPESLVVPDADRRDPDGRKLSRGAARDHLPPELTRSVDVLIRELNAAEKAKEWTEPVSAG